MKLVLLKEDQMIIDKKSYDAVHAIRKELFKVWEEDLHYVENELAKNDNVSYGLFRKTEDIGNHLMDMWERLGVAGFLFKRLE